MKLTPQEESILAHLRSGKHITPLEALGVYGVFRLGARIFNIKAYLAEQGNGEAIATTRVVDSRKKQYARYRLVKAEPRITGTITGRAASSEKYVPNFVLVDPPRMVRNPADLCAA